MKIFGNKPTLSAWFGLTVVSIFVFISIFTPWLDRKSTRLNSSH